MSAWLGLAAVLLLVATNAFFVAAEFGLVAARRPVIEEQAEQGSRRAAAALREMRNVSFMLSGAQLGITASSLLLGYVAEPSFAAMLEPLLTSFDLPGRTALGVSLIVGLVVSTLFQMVVGELAPKNLAIAKPEATSLAVALPMRAYAVIAGPLIRIFDSAANVLTRLFGYEPQEELLAGYSPDELALIFEASSEEGALSEEQAELLLRAVELGDRRVTEIMVPRPDVVWLHIDDPVEALRRASRDTGHSRFPVHGGAEDDVEGTVHIKDLLDLDPDRLSEATLREIVYDAIVVPETHNVRRLLSDLRRRHRTFAVVVDEYGGVAGIVTLEDVLEELVGEIEDEFDVAAGGVALRRVGVGRYVVPGNMRVDRLEEQLDIEIEEGDFETAAGFVIERLGEIPATGDHVEIEGWRFVVSGIDGMRITELSVEALDRPGRAT
ncbi:MAG: hemolysin family protein [Actinobacteria bacterium]|nr:hemolysin family protein [Actinomycetota bacterium]